MKKTLLTGIAALFLATGAAAHAEQVAHEPDLVFDCQGITVTRQHVSDGNVYNVEIIASRRDKDPLPVIVYDVRNQKLKVNGKPCKPVEVEKP
jgi:hypothetical protein